MKKTRLFIAAGVLLLPMLAVPGRAPLAAQESQRSKAGGRVNAEAQANVEKDGSVNEDLMSPMGRLAHLVATGRMARMIEKARPRVEGRTIETGPTKKHGAAIGLSAGLGLEPGDAEDDEEGPAGGQAETTIAVDSTGQHVVIGLNDFRGIGLNPLSVSGFAYSDDGGATFVDGGQLPVTTTTSTIGTTIFPLVFGDPEVKYLGGSNFIYFSIIIKKFTATGTAQTMGVHRSTDFGHTWQGPFEIPPATNPNGLVSGPNAFDEADKEFADVDPETGRVILSWSNFTFGVEISATFSDNIMTATPPTWSTRQILGATFVDGQGAIPRFAGNGSSNAYVAWSRFPGSNQNVGFARSTDNGATWSAPVNTTSDFFTMDEVLGNDRVHNFPSLAVDTSSGPNQGNVYVVYSNNNNHDGADIAFQRSTNGGIAFSGSILLNSRPGSDRAQWFPWVTVDRTSGRVYVFYYDQGIDTSGDLTETTYLFSDDGGVTWSKPMPLTDRPFRAGHGNDTFQPNLGDYNQAVAQTNRLFVVWAGTEQLGFTDGLPSASMTTPDIFFKNLPGSSVKVSLSLGSVTFTDGNGNGFIDAGEPVSLKLPLKNYVTNPLSMASVTGIAGTLSSATAGVSVTQAASTYPDLAPGASATNAADYMIQLSLSFVPGTPIELALSVSTAQGSTNLLHRQPTGTPGVTTMFSENFDSVAPGTLPVGWATSHGGGNNTVRWTTSNTFNPGSNGAFHRNANDGLSGNHARWERLFSPVISLPTNAEYVTLDFDVKYDTEDDPGFNILAYDGFFLRITDFGPTSGSPSVIRSVLTEAYSEEFTTGNFKHHPKHLPRNFDPAYFQDMSAWAGDSLGVKHVHMKLPGMQGRFAQLRFEFTQDQIFTCANVRPGHTCGVLVDNIVMNSVVTVQADLAVSKTAAPTTVLSGSNITYTINAVNNGPSSSNSVTVMDSTPPNTTFVSASAPAGWAVAMAPAPGGTGVIKFTKASMAASETAQFTIVVNVNCPTPNNTVIGNTTTISSADPLTPDNDSSNNSSTKMVTVSNPPPVIINESVDKPVLWPPNHEMVKIAVNYDVMDNCGTPVCTLSVISNEPDNGLGDGDTPNDIQVVDNHHVILRAERSGAGTGRIYTITITCSDSGGGVSTKTVKVMVPHDQR